MKYDARSSAARSMAPTSSRRWRRAASTAAISTSSTTASSPTCRTTRSSKRRATSIATASTCRVVGDLPLGCAAVCNVSIRVQRMAVEAAVHGDDKLLRRHA